MEITKEQKLQIVALNAQGKSIKAIAQTAKVSESNVIAILANYATPKDSTTNLIKPRLTANEINEMYRLADEGLSVRKIASKVGRGVSTVKRQLIKRGQAEDPKPEPAPALDPDTDPKPEPQLSTAPEAPAEETKEKEPAPAPTETSSKKDNVYLNDSTVIKLCQEALLRIGDRIVECDGDSYILGYVHSTLDLIKTIKGDDDENV